MFVYLNPYSSKNQPTRIDKKKKSGKFSRHKRHINRMKNHCNSSYSSSIVDHVSETAIAKAAPPVNNSTQTVPTTCLPSTSPTLKSTSIQTEKYLKICPQPSSKI